MDHQLRVGGEGLKAREVERELAPVLEHDVPDLELRAGRERSRECGQEAGIRRRLCPKSEHDERPEHQRPDHDSVHVDGSPHLQTPCNESGQG